MCMVNDLPVSRIIRVNLETCHLTVDLMDVDIYEIEFLPTVIIIIIEH